jgi:hypothetical protein
MKNILLKAMSRGLRMKGTMWVAVIAVSLITGAMMIPRDAKACCFYNKADCDIAVSFNCGWFCGNKWTINPDQHKCRPGKGGIATIRPSEKMHSCDIEVAKHGWVEVTHAGDKGVVVSKDDNGNITRTCTFDWHKDKPTPTP